MVAGAQILTDELAIGGLSKQQRLNVASAAPTHAHPDALYNNAPKKSSNGGLSSHFTTPSAPINLRKSSCRSIADGKEPFKNPPIIYLMSILSAMGGFLFGYDTGIVSGAMVFIKDQFRLNSVWQELVVSITILGAWVLSIFAGNFSERYGRKGVILWASAIFALGSVIMGFAWSKWVLLIGRLIVGLAIGLASTVVPMYIAEVAPAEIRGSLVTLNNCFITFGQFSAAVIAGIFSTDKENGWRWMLSLAAVPSVIQFFGFLFMPESPRWLIRRDQNNEAFDALQKIRGKNNPCLSNEFEQIRLNQLELMKLEARRKLQKRSILVAIFRKTATRRALFVGCLLQATQQISGINTIMYYAGTIFEMSGVQSQSMAVWLVVPTSFAYVVFSFFGYLIADRVGRRTLTLTSLFLVIISLLVLGLGFQLKSMDSQRVIVHDAHTSSACFTKLDCSDCISDARCGFCVNHERPEVTLCLARSLQNPETSQDGECRASNLSPANNNNLTTPQLSYSFITHVCPTTTREGMSFSTWLVLGSLITYLAVFAPGLGPMPWAINSEIYPMWARGICYSIATSINWLFNLIISLTFISLSEAITTHGSFYLYAMLSSIGWLLLFWKLPETAGRSLEEVTLLFKKSTDQSTIDESDPNFELPPFDDDSASFDNTSTSMSDARSTPAPRTPQPNLDHQQTNTNNNNATTTTTRHIDVPSQELTLSNNQNQNNQKHVQAINQQLDINNLIEQTNKKLNSLAAVNSSSSSISTNENSSNNKTLTK